MLDSRRMDQSQRGGIRVMVLNKANTLQPYCSLAQTPGVMLKSQGKVIAYVIAAIPGAKPVP